MSDYEEQLRAADKVPNLTSNVPVQFGQSLEMQQVDTNFGMFATVAKDVIRWRGISQSDLQPMRIYLGPWQPQPDCVPISIAGPPPFFYVPPTPWTSFPPTVYDSMLRSFDGSGLYARISFGGGGVQHQAYVDWPPRGLLCQVSANYVQVDGVGNIRADLDAPSRYPVLLAHVAPEPGGGDAVNAATFTYPILEQGISNFTFQVPPFARAFTPLLNRFALNQIGGGWLLVQELSQQLIFSGPGHQWSSVVGQEWPDATAIPLSGVTSAINVQMKAVGGGNFGNTFACGMMFHLDL